METYVLIAMVVIMSSATLFIFFTKNQTKKKFEKILPGDNYQGIKYTHKYFPGSKNSPPYFKIGIPFKSDGDFCVVKESKTDVFFKKLGINREVQTGDIEFDGKYYILSNTPDFSRHAFNSSYNRKAADAILAAGFTEVRHNGKIIEAKWNNLRAIEILDPALINRTLDNLILLQKNIFAYAPPPAMMGFPLWKAKRAAVFAVVAMVAAAGLGLFIWAELIYRPLDVWEFFFDSLKISVPLFCIFIWLAALILRGRSHSHRELVVIFWISFVGFPLFVFGSQMAFNGHKDKAPPVSHLVKIVNKYKTHSKNSTTYHVDLASWRRGHATERLTVSSSLYKKVNPNRSYLKIVTRPGALNREWVCSYDKTLQESQP